MGSNYYRSMNAPIVKGVEFQAKDQHVLVSYTVPGQIKPEFWQVPPDHVVMVRCVDGKVLMSACPASQTAGKPVCFGPIKGD